AGLAPSFAASRSRLALIALLFALSVIAWWWTVERMRGMDAGPGADLGTLGWFLGVWVVMMAAMMFPSVSPTVALYSRMTRRRAQDGRPTRRVVRRLLLGADGVPFCTRRHERRLDGVRSCPRRRREDPPVAAISDLRDDRAPARPRHPADGCPTRHPGSDDSE